MGQPAGAAGEGACGELFDHAPRSRRVRGSYLYGELRTLRELRREHAGDPLLRVLLDSAAGHVEADLRLADQVEDDADQLASALSAAPSAGAMESAEVTRPAVAEGQAG